MYLVSSTAFELIEIWKFKWEMRESLMQHSLLSDNTKRKKWWNINCTGQVFFITTEWMQMKIITPKPGIRNIGHPAKKEIILLYFSSDTSHQNASISRTYWGGSCLQRFSHFVIFGIWIHSFEIFDICIRHTVKHNVTDKLVFYLNCWNPRRLHLRSCPWTLLVDSLVSLHLGNNS